MNIFGRVLIALQSVLILTAAAKLEGPPTIQPALARTIARGVTLIPDPRVNFVPNIGIIEGTAAVLVVDTGLGPENGRRAAEAAMRIAGKRTVYLTTTHFHPEHNFGAQSFQPGAKLVMNESQARELTVKGQSYIDLFKTFGPEVAKALAGTQLAKPDQTYTREMSLDLGGRTVVLRETPAHTLGDQVIWVPDVGVLFTGDLIENRFFPIFPDADSKGDRWIQVTDELRALHPKIVVPGHGAISDAGLIQTTGQYLREVRQAVRSAVPSDLQQEELTRKLTRKLRALHPDWDNAVFIPYEIAIFYAEATHTAVRLPDLEAELGKKGE